MNYSSEEFQFISFLTPTVLSGLEPDENSSRTFSPEMTTVAPGSTLPPQVLADYELYSSSSAAFTRLLWSAAFSLMLCIAFLGNILIIWIVLAHRRMRTVTNYFLLNLSVADLTMATLNGVPNSIYMIQKEWIFGSVLCMVNNFVATLTVSSCVFTMTAISIDRYLAIVRPLQPRMTKGLARRAIAAIWFIAAILALPSLIFSERVTYPPDEPNSKAHCVIRWPDEKNPSESNIDLGYNICLLLLTYVVPMVAMGVCYSSMSHELWGQRQIGESIQRRGESIASKRKIVRMFTVIVTTFAMCWFPYHFYFIYQYYDSSIVYQIWAQHLYLSFYWLAMSTSMINPLIYYMMNSRFREHIKKVAASCCYCRRRFRGRHPEINMGLQCSHSRSDYHREGNNGLNPPPKSLIVTRNHLHLYHHPISPNSAPNQASSHGKRWNGSSTHNGNNDALMARNPSITGRTATTHC